jgi:hypothetical protein
MTDIDTSYDKSHGSPYDRGSADAYYGRRYAPHYYVMSGMMFSERIEVGEMAEDEIRAYAAGYEEEDDRKDWR